MKRAERIYKIRKHFQKELNKGQREIGVKLYGEEDWSYIIDDDGSFSANFFLINPDKFFTQMIRWSLHYEISERDYIYGVFERLLQYYENCMA